jgi:hypothetical protein
MWDETPIIDSKRFRDAVQMWLERTKEPIRITSAAVACVAIDPHMQGTIRQFQFTPSSLTGFDKGDSPSILGGASSHSPVHPYIGMQRPIRPWQD